MTKRNKIIAAVLVLAGGAFAADRLTGGGQIEAQTATAGPSADSAIVTSTASPKPAQPKVTAPGMKSLAVRLQDAAEADHVSLAEIPDAFRLPASWVPARAPGAPPAAAEFQAKYKLTAVMKGRSAKSGLAIINGKTLRPGETIDGFRLVAVNDQSASFASATAEVDLNLEAR